MCKLRDITHCDTNCKMTVTFLDLPAELRNRIYHLTLVCSDPISGHYVRVLKDAELRYDGIKEPAVLQASRQVRSEALPILYGSNTFYIYGELVLRSWMQRLGADRVDMLQTILFNTPAMYDAESVQDGILAVKQDYLEESGVEVPDDVLYLLVWNEDRGTYYSNGLEKVKRC